MWIKLNYGDMYIKVKMVAKNESKKSCDVTEREYKYDGWLFQVMIRGSEKKNNTQRDFYMLYISYSGFALTQRGVPLLVFFSITHCRLSILTIK